MYFSFYTFQLQNFSFLKKKKLISLSLFIFSIWCETLLSYFNFLGRVSLNLNTSIIADFKGFVYYIQNVGLFQDFFFSLFFFLLSVCDIHPCFFAFLLILWWKLDVVDCNSSYTRFFHPLPHHSLLLLLFSVCLLFWFYFIVAVYLFSDFPSLTLYSLSYLLARKFLKNF